jgi:uncharacterized repeat protein (TIGR03803 family)
MQKRRIRPGICAWLTFTLCAMVPVSSALAATEKVLYSFNGNPNGNGPQSGLTSDAAGNLYGSTFFGGSAGQGVIYKLTHSSTGWTETILYNFQGGAADGAKPQGTLILDTAGNIYGTATLGGSGNGIVFELSPSGGSYRETVLHVFAYGQSPINAGVIRDTAGNLYGETAGGGSFSSGTIYELKHTTAGYSYQTLYNFAGGNDGYYPSGGLIFGRAGIMYGTTAGGGGPANAGTVFEMKRNTNGTWTETVIHGFQSYADGFDPETPVVVDNAGNLFGTTLFGGSIPCDGPSGCGEVFELSPSGTGTWTKTLLHAFSDTPDGRLPAAGLAFNKAGHLFGTTENGGGGTGTLYELAPQSGGGWTESIVYSFGNGGDGGFPVSPVIVNRAGNIFGTTLVGGTWSGGVVYEFTGVSAQ